MTPKAFFTGRAIGVTTARALTLRMAGVVLPMCVSLFLFDTVPPHEPRRGPIGRERLDQPSPRMFGQKRHALGLSGLDCECVEPERLPAVVEPVEQAEMMSVQMKHGGDIG